MLDNKGVVLMDRGLGLVLRNMSSASIATIAAAAEDAGFTHLFLPETSLGATPIYGRDPFITSAAALAATSAMRVGPGIAASTVRAARSAGVSAATLNEDSGGRFILGVGVSHGPVIASLGIDYPTSPLGQISNYVQELRTLSAGGVEFGGGFKVLVGALGPKMVALGARESDGVVLNWLTPQAAEHTCARISHSDPLTALFIRTGPQRNLEGDARTYRDNLPNYRNHFAAQGLNSVEDVAHEACMPLDPAAIADRLRAYLEHGVRVPCVYPTGMSTDEIVELFGRLADEEILPT